MSGAYHSGEIEVQNKVGVRRMAEKVGNGIRAVIPKAAGIFLNEQRVIAASSVDQNGRVWASLLVGQPGFAQTLNEAMIELKPRMVEGDPLLENLKINPTIGMIAIDAATRRRMRLNGQARLDTNGTIQIFSQQVYANCPRYIQARQPDDNFTSPAVSSTQAVIGDQLTPSQQAWIGKSDTFFVATYHPASSTADASHRGGLPGFVRVLDEHTLIWPDYNGNTMFNTLGNIAANPNTGLVFPDWEGGHLLQLTGQAQIIWDAEQIKAFVGAERLVQFKVEQVIETTNAFAKGWQFLSYSPHNPGQ